MAEDGIEKVLTGITSLDELQRVGDLTSGRHTMSLSPEDVDDGFLSHVV